MGWRPVSSLTVALVLASFSALKATRFDAGTKENLAADDKVTRPDVLELRCLAFEGNEWTKDCEKHTYIMATRRGKLYNDIETFDEGLVSASDDEQEIAALWKLCRSLKSSSGNYCCPAAPKKCHAAVVSAKVSTATQPWHSATLPYSTPPARLMTFIQEYRGDEKNKRFVMSPASRYQPREAPVVSACQNYVQRIRSQIKHQGLELLMRWDPEGYFDVWRKFDSSIHYAPSLKIGVLSVLLGIRVKDEAQADDMWRTLIDRDSARALPDGSLHGDDDEDTILQWWETQLDALLTIAYGTLREIEADATVIQSVAMSKGVKARGRTLHVTKTQIGVTAIISGVAIAATGGSAALPIAVGGAIAGLGFKSVSAVLTEQKRESSDVFGQTHKQHKWIEYMRDWLELWLEKDFVDAFIESRPRLNIKEEVKRKLICNDDDTETWYDATSVDQAQGEKDVQAPSAGLAAVRKAHRWFREKGHGSEAPMCFVKPGKYAEIELKEILIASFVNLVMIDGGCVDPPDLKSEYEGSALTFVGQPAEDVVCCAQSGGEKAGDMCKAHVIQPPANESELTRTGKCPAGWHQVDNNWAFAGLEPGFKEDDVEQTACCGLYNKASLSANPCRISSCSTDRRAPEEQPLEDGEDQEDDQAHNSWQGHCARPHWREDDKLRQEYCKRKKRTTSRTLCGQAQAYSLCKSRRHFCLFYARQKIKSGKGMIRSMGHCLDDLAKLQKLKVVEAKLTQ